MVSKTQEETLLRHKALFTVKLHAWYERSYRDLPWRREPTLYKTVVSEFMLQQTQVETVLPFFVRWLKVFPNFTALAAATEEAVVKHWEGLGYYSRARSLHKLAKEIVQRETVPTSAKEWENFPGVGRYTAAAIASINFAAAVACIDGNVIRILTRLTSLEEVFKSSAAAVKALTPLAQALLDKNNPGKHNQAMMELGALVCLRQKPLCTVCPVVAHCAASRHGDPEKFPRLQPRVTTTTTINRLWVLLNNTLLLQRAPAQSRRLPNIYELPAADGLVIRLSSKNLLATKKRGISNQRIVEKIYRILPTNALVDKVAQSSHLRWIPLQDLNTITLSGPHRRWIEEILT